MSVQFLEADIVEVDDSQFPEIVLCAFVDARGKTWTVREKLPVLCGEMPPHETPRMGKIAGTIVAEFGDTVCFDTETPWGITSVDGVSRFTVYKANLTSSGEDAE